ncbi:hypothetical protein BT96DRAFT_948264 [Gymnopus androsaceus JB14]|uniref:Uncharacterized protein n=1 Tax=Gymnopus androsaceus JB14 TaxID=1447944 RepID=A0A6A4GP50_9AGAR|nr:hypothetical protein BT96DRAFT_948264 [Gymnopus androsaceus JB14]
MHEDLWRNQGPNKISRMLTLEGQFIPRRVICYVIRQADPEGPAHQYPGRKKPIDHTPLVAQGTWQEHHGDGHEKLAKAALHMGPVSLPIYGYKDKWCSVLPFMRFIPDDQHADCIAHLYLDFVDEYGEIDLSKHPAVVQLKSVHNTPIESVWHWFQQDVGQTLYLRITHGRDNDLFQPHNDLHIFGLTVDALASVNRNLFNWIWPPIVQDELNRFCKMWNLRVPRKQKDKIMPSGVTPLALWEHPECYGGERFSIPVPKELIAKLRKEIKTPYEEAFAFVSPQFNEWANFIYHSLGCPEVDAASAWGLFSRMEVAMKVQMEQEQAAL